MLELMLQHDKIIQHKQKKHDKIVILRLLTLLYCVLYLFVRTITDKRLGVN